MRAPNFGLLLPLGALLIDPTSTRAQSVSTAGIAGVVRDATRTLPPGVRVEAVSPALIERVRTVVTDREGSTRMLELRPGGISSPSARFSSVNPTDPTDHLRS
jgi:hypothetical protein